MREKTTRTKQAYFKINMSTLHYSTPISNTAFNIFLWGGRGEGKGELYLWKFIEELPLQSSG